jgi:hypothetical protein
VENLAWPSLRYDDWAGTCAALHLWTQMVGKVRTAATPWLNHSWQTPLYLSPRGLTTGIVHVGDRALDLEFDFVDQVLSVRTDGPCAAVALEPMSTAEFHACLVRALEEVGTPVRFHGAPNELPDATPFAEDVSPRPYDGEAARRFWRVLLSADRAFRRFRTGFLGKASPVHFFWGSFDLAVTRFSGRPAPPHPGGVPHLPDAVAREAYSHEVSSAGFWPGGQGQDAAFYAYAYPAPPGFAEAKVRPAAAYFDSGLGEFLLPYAALRAEPDPVASLTAFLESTYATAAELAGWDRAALECGYGEPGRPRPV